MQEKQLREFLETYINGRYVKAQWQSITQTKNYTLVKKSSGVVRMGIAYSHLKQNKDVETKGLSYGHFEIDNVLIEHNGKKQVRMYPSACPKHRTHTTYIYNGVEKTKQELIEMGVLDSKPRKAVPCFNVKLENLISLG